jgi:hypothetical protein
MSDINTDLIQDKKIGVPFISVIPDALRTYDENTEKFMKIRKKIKYFSTKKIDDNQYDNENKTDHINFSFYDKDKNYLFTSRIELVGKYYEDQNIWIWGWALPKFNKSDSATIRNIFIYGTDINVVTGGIMNNEKLLLKNTLITSRSITTDIIQVEIYCALASYLGKKVFVLPFVNIDFEEGTEYIVYTDLQDNDIQLDLNNTNENRKVYYMYILDPPDI